MEFARLDLCADLLGKHEAKQNLKKNGVGQQ